MKLVNEHENNLINTNAKEDLETTECIVVKYAISHPKAAK